MIVVKILKAAVFVSLLSFMVLPVFAMDTAWTYTENHGEIGGVSVSSTGSLVVVSAGKLWIFARNGTLLTKGDYGNEVSMTPDGSFIASSYFSRLYLFQRTGSPVILKKLWETELAENIHSVDISRNGKTITLATDGSGLYVYGQDGALAGYNDSYVSIIKTSAEGEMVVGTPLEGLIEYSGTGRYIDDYDLDLQSRPTNMALSSKGTICVFNQDQKLRSIFTGNGTTFWDSRATGNVMSLSMTPAGSSIIAGTENGHIDHFDASGNLSWSFNANPENKQGLTVTSVAVSDNGGYIAAGTFDGRILVLNSKGELRITNQTKEHIRHIAISGDGSLAVATGDETVYALSSSTAPQSNPISSAAIPKPGPTRNVTFFNATPDNSPKKEVSKITETPTEYSVVRSTPESGLSALTTVFGFLFILIFVRLKN